MHRAKRPYWLGSLDRWNVLVVGILVVLLIVLNASGLSRAPQVAGPALPPPVAGTSLQAGQPGVITGTTAPNAPVRVLDGDVPLGETTADAGGQWRLAVPALSPGPHTLTAQTLDADGNVVATSEPLTVTVTEPTSIAGRMPEIKLPAAGLKADMPLELEGTGTSGTTVQLYDGDQVVGETVVAPDGTWKITLPPLTPGAHNLVAKLLGADGKEQSASAPVELTVVDGQIVVATVVPSAPTAARTPEIKRPVVATLEVGEPITLSGTGTPGTAVTLYDGDVVFAETTVAPDGTWQMTVPPLGAGANSLTTSLLVVDGKEQSGATPVESTISEGQNVGAAPAAVAGSKRSLALLRPSRRNVGAAPAASRQSSEPQTLDGTGMPGAAVTVYDGDEPIASTTVAPDGTWSLTVPPLADGTHNLVARQVGADGQAQGESTPLELAVVDGQIIVTTPTTGLWAGEPPTLEGVGTPGATVTVYANGVAVDQTTVAPDGTWTMPLPPQEVARALAAPSATNATPTGTAGTDVSPVAAATPAPSAAATAVPGAGAPVIQPPAAGLQAGEPLTLTGTGTPGMQVQVADGARVVGEGVVGPDGTWQVTVPPLTAGTHSLVAKQVGADDTVQGVSVPLALTVADEQIVVATPVAGAPAVVAPAIKLPAAGLRAGEPLTLTGTGTPGMRVQVADGARAVGEAVVGPDGTWTLTVPPLTAGRHSLAAKQVGADDTVQGASAPLELAVADGQIVVATPAAVAGVTAVPGAGAAPTVSPTAAAIAGAATAVATAAAGLPSTVTTPVAGPTPIVSAPAPAATMHATAEAGGMVTLEGTATPGATVKAYDGDTLLGEATVGADGKWTMTMPMLAAGQHSLVAKLFGADGTEQGSSQELSISVPATPGAELTVLPLISPPAGGTLPVGRTLELAGTAAPGVLLKLFDGGKLLGQATADESGNWKMSVPPLNTGEHTLTAITYGPDGEVQASSKPLTVSVSEPEPAAATGPAVKPTIGWPPDGSAVVSARPLVAGQSFPRGVVRIYDGATLLGETIADANGYWSFRPSVALTAGEHVLTAVATSADGLTTAKASPVTITVRSRAVTIPSWKPAAGAAPVVITPESGDTVHTVQPLFAGTAAPNSKVRLYDGDQVMGEAAVDADGRWTFRPTAPLAEGEHIIAVAPLNADGSEGAAKDTVTITIASGLGSAPGGPGIIVDSTPASSANSRPVLTGQAPAGATIRVYDGDQLLGEVKSGPDGHWYYTPAAPLTAGDHVLRFEMVGADGSAVASTETPITVAAGAPSVKPPQITSPSQGQAAPGDVLSGTAPAGSQVQIYDGNTLIGGTTAGANGKWRFRLPANLTAGAHDIHVVAVDQTGLPVSQSKAAAIVVAPPRTLPVTGAAATGD